MPNATNESSIRAAVQSALALLFSHPALILLAIAAWGLGSLTLQEHILWGALALLEVVAEPALLGLAAAMSVERTQVTWARIGQAIRRYWIGVLFLRIFFTLPLLILVPLLALLIGVFQSNHVIEVLVFGPLTVPLVAATWSLVLRGQNPIEAVAGGLLHFRPVWIPATLLGIGYTTIAHLLRPARAFLIANDALALGIALDVVWAGAEALMRLTILFWLFRRYLQK